MPTFTYECDSEAELALVRQATCFVSEMHRLAHNAPAPSVLSAVEDLALDQGRQLLRDTLQAAAQARIDADEKKKGRRVSALSATASAAPRDDTPNT